MKPLSIKLEITQPEATAQFMTEGMMPDKGNVVRPVYTFDLLHKKLDLGPCQLRHYWIDRGKLYPSRKRHAPMYGRILSAFWDICRSESSHDDPEVQESYLLAKLLPHIRPNKAAKVFLDSVTHGRDVWAPKKEAVEQLACMLTNDIKPMSTEAFHKYTADVLGPPSYDDACWELYDEMSEQLLDQGRELITASDAYTNEAINVVRKRWEGWLTNIGRRHGKEHQKLMLDILSYESKAAFHRAYSAVWDRFIRVLQRGHGMDRVGRRFHRFWHLNGPQPSKEYPTRHAHLFHGHVLGLHPASAAFISTATGRRLLGQWLIDDREERFDLLLGGLAIAITQYQSVYEGYQLDRRMT